jgi:type II restriction enzyme
MNLNLDRTVSEGYTSGSQIARKLSESWVAENAFCPACGNRELASFANNNPVGDFYCPKCRGEYELKSKQDGFSQRIVDGAYASMIQRINAENNPHFFFLNYSPKHFFVDSIIECRKPLAATARRAGWTGCNILLSAVPESGKIFFVRNGAVTDYGKVLSEWQKMAFLGEQKLESRGWTIEVLKVVERIPGREFGLAEVYAFESELESKFPANRFVKDKIRQQLQVLRDKGVLEFLGGGNYRKL